MNDIWDEIDESLQTHTQPQVGMRVRLMVPGSASDGEVTEYGRGRWADTDHFTVLFDDGSLHHYTKYQWLQWFAVLGWKPGFGEGD